MSRNKIRWNSILLFLFLFGGFGTHCRIVQPRVNGTENLVGRGGESAIKENPEKITTEEAENDPRDATGILSEHKPNENGTIEGQSQPNENETIEGQSQLNEIPTKFDLTGEKEGKPFDTENPDGQTEERDLGMFIQTKGKNDTIDEETKNLEKEQKREEIAEGERKPIMNGQPSANESGVGFIRLFPFLKGANSESIEQFRSLLHDQSLSKGELEKKRQEWAEKQPLEIKTSYLDWKERLDKSKKKTIGRIEKKLTIFIKGVKSLYKKIKAIVLDQKISRSVECEQICSAIDSAPQEMREFFLQIKLIKFCLTQAKMAKPGENNQISQNSMIKFDEQMNQDSTNPKMDGHENAQMAQPVLVEEKRLKFPVGNIVPDNEAPENSPNTPVTAEGNDQKGKIDDKSSMASVEEVGRDDPSKKDNPKWPNLDVETSTWKPDPVPDPKKNPDESSSSSSSSSSESVENEVKEAINKETPADEGKGEKKVEKSDQEKPEKKQKTKKEGETSSSSSSSDSSSGSSSSSSSSSSDENEKKDGKEKNKVKKGSKEDKGKEDEEDTDSSSSENDKKSKKKDKKEENSKVAKEEKRAHGKKKKVESSSSSSSDTDSVEKGKKEDESSPITNSDDAEKEKHHEKKRKRDGKKGHGREENGKKEAKEETGPPSDADDEEPVKVHKKHKKTEEASAADE